MKKMPLSFLAVCFFLIIFSTVCFADFPYLGHWSYSGTRRDGVARSGQMNFSDDGKFTWTIVDADHQSDGSGAGSWTSSGSYLTLNFGYKVWSGPASSADSNAFNFSTNHGSYNFTRLSIFTTGGATIDPSTYIIHIPCVAVGADYYWVDLQISTFDPLTIKFFKAGKTTGYSDYSDFSTLDLNTLTLHISSLWVNGRSYKLSLPWNPAGFFDLGNVEDTGSYGEEGQCYVGCAYHDVTGGPLRCAVSCDSLFGGDFALQDSGYSSLRLGPTSWDACANHMRELEQPGW